MAPYAAASGTVTGASHAGTGPLTRYIEQRRATSTDDYMSQLAHVRFPDGDLPKVEDVVRLEDRYGRVDAREG